MPKGVYKRSKRTLKKIKETARISTEGGRRKNLFKEGHSGYWKGKKRSVEDVAKMKIRKAKRSVSGRSGVNRSFRNTLRDTGKYRDWRKSVFTRDEYACTWCGDDRGGNLEADHIIPFAAIIEKIKFEKGSDDLFNKAMDYELLWDTNNGRTLCKPCHRKTPTWGRCSRGISK